MNFPNTSEYQKLLNLRKVARLNCGGVAGPAQAFVSPAQSKIDAFGFASLDKKQLWKMFWGSVDQQYFSEAADLAKERFLFVEQNLLCQRFVPEIDLLFNRYNNFQFLRQIFPSLSVENFRLISKLRFDSEIQQIDFVENLLQKFEETDFSGTKSAPRIRKPKVTKELLDLLIEYLKHRCRNIKNRESLVQKKLSSPLVGPGYLRHVDAARYASVMISQLELDIFLRSLQKATVGKNVVTLKFEGSRKVFFMLPSFPYYEQVKKSVEKTEFGNQPLCHYCRKNCSFDSVLKCSGLSQTKHKSKGRPAKRSSSTDSLRKSSCSRFFCRSCLYKNFDGDLMEEGCPFCTGKCFCEGCVKMSSIRKMQEGGLLKKSAETVWNFDQLSPTGILSLFSNSSEILSNGQNSENLALGISAKKRKKAIVQIEKKIAALDGLISVLKEQEGLTEELIAGLKE